MLPPAPIEALGVEQEEVVEGLCGKVKGWSSEFRLNDMLLKDLGRCGWTKRESGFFYKYCNN